MRRVGLALLLLVAALLLPLAAPAGVRPTAAAQDMMSGTGPEPAVVHDPAYFRDRVLPLLEQQCGGCHGGDDPGNQTRHKVFPPTGPDGKSYTAEDVRRNFESARALTRPDAPERSLLLSKLTPTSRGGVDHDGGKANDTDLPASLLDPQGPLVSWVFGATPTDAPPVAVYAPVPKTIAVGEALRLDATLSRDAEGKEITVTWEVADAPQGARAKVADPRQKTTTITPDREGPWVVRLRVSDGKLRGWPAMVRFAATRKKDDGASAPAAPSAPVDTTTRRITRSLFLDLLGRTPDAQELGRWAALPLEQRIDGLLDLEDTWRNWMEEEAFYFLLIDQFRPASDRLLALPARLREGSATFREAHLTFALSAEFNQRNPGNDTYCTVVFEQFLGMEVQKGTNVRTLETAKKIYDGKQDKIFNVVAKNQSDIVQVTLAQKAYTDLFVRRMAARYLGTELPATEHDAAVSVLQSQPGQFRAVLREWLLSDRYAGATRPLRKKTDQQFIRSLFVDLLGRSPAYEEFRNMRNALQALADPTPVRGVLAKVLLDSSAAVAPEERSSDVRYASDRVRSQVLDLFRRLLGRDPSQEELDAFAAVLAEPDATWRTAALAILTSPQYQTY